VHCKRGLVLEAMRTGIAELSLVLFGNGVACGFAQRKLSSVYVTSSPQACEGILFAVSLYKARGAVLHIGQGRWRSL
jgi:hypothetical protein